jgi:hypothetical protein
MDRNLLIKRRPYVYHLTANENIANIYGEKRIYSTRHIVEMSGLSDEEQEEFLTSKRIGHKILTWGDQEISIRDQDPINLNLLPRCLIDGVSVGEFINILNQRVFFWPTIPRLFRHYSRYEPENPIIIRVRTKDILDLNVGIDLSSINSGATRCHPSYGGNPPPRGNETFVPIDDWAENIGSIAEVTILDSCILPDNFQVSNHYNGPWREIDEYLNTHH